jgi:hypothetical protein
VKEIVDAEKCKSGYCSPAGWCHPTESLPCNTQDQAGRMHFGSHSPTNVSSCMCRIKEGNRNMQIAL